MVTYPSEWTPMQLRDIGYIQMCRRIFQSQTKAYAISHLMHVHAV